MKKLNQKGFSVVEVIMVIVIVGLIGAVGWLVYDRQQDKSETQEQKTSITTESKSEPAEEMKIAYFEKSFPAQLSFSYPASWKLTEESGGPLTKPGQTVGHVFTVTSPSKKYSVVFHANTNGGLGGYCTPSEEGKLISLSASKLQNFTNASFVQAIYPVSHGISGYDFDTELMETDGIAGVEEGDSRCELYLDGVIDLTAKENFTLSQAYIDIKGLTNDGSEDFEFPASVEEIKQAFETAEYKQAVEILKSTTLEK